MPINLPVLYYEVSITEDIDRRPVVWERTEDARPMFDVHGLAIGHRYRVRVRAVNATGRGQPSEAIYITPEPIVAAAAIAGQAIPLVDTDRQSLIVRLAGIDVRLYIWWQPLDGAWYGSAEIPVNNPVSRSRRLINGASLLDRDGILPGNVVLRSVGDDYAGLNPDRNAWRIGSHVLRWESN